VSNTRRLRQQPRPPDGAERAFRDELRKGCPYCGSRRVLGRFHDGTWDYGLRCEPDCRTHAQPVLAHRIASEAAKRAAAAAGEPLIYQAVDSMSGTVAGVVRGTGPG
jgi:hypothetical protein